MTTGIDVARQGHTALDVCALRRVAGSTGKTARQQSAEGAVELRRRHHDTRFEKCVGAVFKAGGVGKIAV